MKHGKILKIRIGYNPNNSAFSMAAMMFIFVTPIVVVANVIAGWITAAFLYRRLKEEEQ
jgi:hypothetical protein